MAVEAKRGCGFRKIGGLYLVGRGRGVTCDRLPIPLDVCPTCSRGIKPSRGWTWIDVAGLVGGVHLNCTDDFPCPLCMTTERMGKAGLLWVGGKFYPTPEDFAIEAAELGISRRISAVPRDFEIGKTWVLLAHQKRIRVEFCQTEGCEHLPSVHTEKGCAVVDCECEEGRFWKPAVFYVFKPTGIEKIVVEGEDPEVLQDLVKRGITPVSVPADDRDHQGSVHDKAEETE
jgi:hypothetical protein